MFGLNPYGLALKAAIVLAALIAGFVGGYKVESWHAQARELAAVEAAEAAVQKGADQERAAAVAAVQQEEKIRVVYQTVTKQVTKWRDRPVARAVCLDADGVQLANAALRGPTEAGPQPHGAVPGAGGGSRDGPGGRDPRQAHPGIAPIL